MTHEEEIHKLRLQHLESMEEAASAHRGWAKANQQKAELHAAYQKLHAQATSVQAKLRGARILLAALVASNGGSARISRNHVIAAPSKYQIEQWEDPLNGDTVIEVHIPGDAKRER